MRLTKEIRELVREIESRAGTRIVEIGHRHNHYRLRLRDGSGPVLVVPATSSDRRGRRNAVSMARRLLNGHCAHH